MDEREARIRELLPVVRTIARRIRRLVTNVDLDDLIGDGSIGLIRAVDHFDPKRGPSLEHYARQLIAGAMLNGIRRMDPVSERARRAIRDGENERYRLAVERGEMPRVSDLERLLPGFKSARAIAHRAQPLSLDAPLPDGERVPGDWSADPAALAVERASSAALRRAVARLPKRERVLVSGHYFGERSLRDLSRRLAISPQRASQLHIAAVSRLRKDADAAAC